MITHKLCFNGEILKITIQISVLSVSLVNLATFSSVRAKNIQNKPKINEDPKDALLRQYQEEIMKLKAMLMGQLPIPEGGFSGQYAITPQPIYLSWNTTK